MNKVIRNFSVVLAAVMILSGCSPTDNPALSTYQEITKNLLGGQPLSWEKHVETAEETGLRIDLAFSTSGGGNMQSSCFFAPDNANDEDALGDVGYDSAPGRIVLNGRQVDQRSLTQATLRATSKAITETAQHTVQESQKNLEAASAKAKKVAHDASEKARVMAGQAKESARQVTLDAAKKVQSTLEK